MDRPNPYHPTGNAIADGIKARTDALVDELMRGVASGGPSTHRMAGLAMEKYREASHWVGQAFLSEDFLAGDAGGLIEGEHEERDGQSDP
jgi:hypothetical protein